MTLFAQTLRATRKDRGLGIRKAAEQSGLTPSTFSLAENGRMVSVPALRKLCMWLDIDTEWAIYEIEGLPAPRVDMRRAAYLMGYINENAVSVEKEIDAGWTATIHDEDGNASSTATGWTAMEAVENLIAYVNDANK